MMEAPRSLPIRNSSEERWVRLRPKLRQLYLEEGRPLSAVKRVLERDDKFYATYAI